MHNHISKQKVFRLKHQAVRDLAWSLWGPALLIHSAPYNETINSKAINSATYFPIDEPWLWQLDKHPEALSEYLQQKNTRLLGTYFEALWQFYFSQHPSFTQCICNLQINDANRTVGEFDALVTNALGQNFHVELTCKFYLEWQDEQQTKLWLGPNCGDRLDIKYHKTDTHQLPLLKTELGQKNYNEHIFNTNPVQQLAIWRGTAFSQTHWIRIQELANNTTINAWRSSSNTNDINNNQILWFIADKSVWLSPITQVRENLKTYEQVCQQINDHFQSDLAEKKHYTIMLIALAFDDENQQWQQQQSFFITPKNWPYGTLADSALTPLRPCKPPLWINK